MDHAVLLARTSRCSKTSQLLMKQILNRYTAHELWKTLMRFLGRQYERRSWNWLNEQQHNKILSVASLKLVIPQIDCSLAFNGTDLQKRCILSDIKYHICSQTRLPLNSSVPTKNKMQSQWSLIFSFVKVMRLVSLFPPLRLNTTHGGSLNTDRIYSWYSSPPIRHDPWLGCEPAATNLG